MPSAEPIQSRSGTLLAAELEAKVPLGVRVAGDLVKLVESDGRSLRFWTVVTITCFLFLFFNAIGIVMLLHGDPIIGAVTCGLGSCFAVVMGFVMWARSPIHPAEVEHAAWRHSGQWVRLRSNAMSGRVGAMRVRTDVVDSRGSDGVYVFVCEYTSDPTGSDGWQLLVWSEFPCRRVVRRLCAAAGIGYGVG